MITEHIVEGETKPLYMDGELYNQLDTKVRPSVQKKDKDWFIAIDGEEGSGKSVFGMQIAKVLDPNFTHEQVAFNSNDFIRLVMRSKKYQCIVFDEAFTGLSSRSSLSEINNLMVSLMMEMRQKNLFIIIIMPTFFMLDKYCALHRAKGLFHVYTRDGKRGYWSFFDRRGMKYLYLNGKKFYEYGSQKPILFGRFQDQYMINESKYREVKSDSLHKKKRATRAEVYKMQRDILFWVLIKNYNKTQQEVSDLCRKEKYKIDRSSISLIIKERMKNKLIDKALQEEVNSEIDKDAEDISHSKTSSENTPNNTSEV